MSLRLLPNIVTGLRILLVLPLVWSLRSGHYAAALVIALVAGTSDGIDGWLAKRFGWRTRLGGLLDPIADKLLLAGAFLGLWLAGAIPGWFLIVVIVRDLTIVGGAIAYNALVGPVQGEPTLISKATTVAQIALVLGLLVGLAGWPLPQAVVVASIWTVAALTVASGLDYVVRWSVRAVRVGRRR